jgi:hypothetical protein
MRELRRLGVIAEMQGRDLTRRHLAMVMLVSLPLVLYFALKGTSDTFSLAAGGIGMAWSVAGAAMFSVQSSHNVDPRLVLSGFSPVELLVGRLAFLEALAFVLASAFSGLMVALSSPLHPWLVVLGIALTAIVAVPLGLALAAVLPHELEGMLALVGIVGVQLALPVDSTLSRALPLQGPLKILEMATGRSGGILSPVLHAIGFAVGLLVVAIALWARRVRTTAHPPVVEAVGEREPVGV